MCRIGSRGIRWISVGTLAVILGYGSRGEESGAVILRPYDGPTAAGIPNQTLAGKVMCGYQGWYACPGDGAGRGWFHYGRGDEFGPGRCSIDLWPDVGELSDEERYPTSFVHADGETAYVYSPLIRETVVRHFRWMRDHGIDGVFVQRFVVQTYAEKPRNHFDTVLLHCREGANRHGRVYAVMYDLSGMATGQVDHVIADWERLAAEMRLTRDEGDNSYAHHDGRPVVGVWGIGFNDGRAYTVGECARIVEYFRDAGCCVMVGVPSGWRTLDADCVADGEVHDVILAADIVSPWTVGRYGTPAEASRHADTRWGADLAWCRGRGKEYLPVVFPGFSWANLNPGSPLGQIPRMGGEFLWRQFHEARRLEVSMVYVAMFDEMDEGTAVFKCTNDPPVGENRFLTYDGFSTDHYLWLTGMGGRMLRGELPLQRAMPTRDPGDPGSGNGHRDSSPAETSATAGAEGDPALREGS